MKGFGYKISDEDQEYIKMLVSSNPTIYRHEVHNLLVENSNTLHDCSDVSLTTIKKTIQFRMENDKNWTRKKTSV